MSSEETRVQSCLFSEARCIGLQLKCLAQALPLPAAATLRSALTFRPPLQRSPPCCQHDFSNERLLFKHACPHPDVALRPTRTCLSRNSLQKRSRVSHSLHLFPTPSPGHTHKPRSGLTWGERTHTLSLQWRGWGLGRAGHRQALQNSTVNSQLVL